MENKSQKDGTSWIDVSAPGKRVPEGHLHPLTKVQREIVDIFGSMGFEVAEGPEVETEHYNFDALNIPANHPARDMWDTFWIKNSKSKTSNPKQIQNSKFKIQNLLLRTHTSPVQIRYMENPPAGGPPIRIIAPGRVFRYEATDKTHLDQFYQLEGLMIDKNITMANLKAVMEVFFKKFFFDKKIEVRLRPSYFPFVEPGFEFDIKRKGGEWLEMGGAGMVHPNVLKNVKINPENWQGFAFGMGIDRLAMIKYKIDDVRLFYSGDLKFIKQF